MGITFVKEVIRILPILIYQIIVQLKIIFVGLTKLMEYKKNLNEIQPKLISSEISVNQANHIHLLYRVLNRLRRTTRDNIYKPVNSDVDLYQERISLDLSTAIDVDVTQGVIYDKLMPWVLRGHTQ